jgi:hypothetical protein
VFRKLDETLIKCRKSFYDRGLIIYDEDETFPRVTFPMNIKFPCPQSTTSLLMKTSNPDHEIFSEVFESIEVPQISQSHYSLSNN